jgi:hypothetical protein
MAINLPPRGRIENGWPFVNYASDERNFNSAPGGARSNTLSLPRMKFTYLVEFQINQRALANPVTNIGEFIQNNGKLYTHLRSLDHPKPQMKMETLRSYNKWIKIPTTIEFSPASMTFHDDSTSVVSALWKEHTHFYSHLGTVGEDISGIGSLSRIDGNNEINSYQFTHILTGEEVRSKMGQRPSLGMKLKANDMRHFFESIVIYDLGTEPDGVNVYWFHHPVITGWDHDNVDKEDRTGNIGVTANFEYESYYFTVGQNRGRIRGFIEAMLGNFPEGDLATQRKDGIARDGRNVPLDTPAELASSFPGAMFPGEDALILQELAQGSSPGALATPRQAAKNLADAAGYKNLTKDQLDAAGVKVSPIAKEEAIIRRELAEDGVGTTASAEPLSPAETANPLPRTIRGKQTELQRVIIKQDQLLAIGQGLDPNDPEQKELLNTSSKLAARRELLTNGLSEQRALENSRRTNNVATQSALRNTQVKNGTAGQTTPINTTKVVNPVNQQKSDALIASADRAEQQANRYTEIADASRIIADSAGARGDNNIARQADAQARQATLDAVKSQAQADFLREEGEDIDNG